MYIKRKNAILKVVSCVIIISVIFSFGACTSSQGNSSNNAKTADEILVSWSETSGAKQAIKSYVEDVCDVDSANFVPVKDRVAVFDVDGTLYSERMTDCLDTGILYYRLYEDPTYKMSESVKADVQAMEEAVQNNAPSTDTDGLFRKIVGEVYKGLTNTQYADIVNQFLDTPVEGNSDLTHRDVLFKPMLEVTQYLQSKEFKVFLVSGCERDALRTLFEDVETIQSDNIIGRSFEKDIDNRTDKNNMKYLYKSGDNLVRATDLISNCWYIDKVFSIDQEIGQRPILAFGNSSGDYSMINYTVLDNKYKSAGFVVNSDDVERENGDPDGNESLVETANNNNWTVISVKNDFKEVFNKN